MSGARFALIRTFQVGPYQVTMSCPDDADSEVVTACLEWEPPRLRPLTASEIGELRAGQDAVLEELADIVGRDTWRARHVGIGQGH